MSENKIIDKFNANKPKRTRTLEIGKTNIGQIDGKLKDTYFVVQVYYGNIIRKFDEYGNAIKTDPAKSEPIHLKLEQYEQILTNFLKNNEEGRTYKIPSKEEVRSVFYKIIEDERRAKEEQRLREEEEYRRKLEEDEKFREEQRYLEIQQEVQQEIANSNDSDTKEEAKNESTLKKEEGNKPSFVKNEKKEKVSLGSVIQKFLIGLSVLIVVVCSVVSCYLTYTNNYQSSTNVTKFVQANINGQSVELPLADISLGIGDSTVSLYAITTTQTENGIIQNAIPLGVVEVESISSTEPTQTQAPIESEQPVESETPSETELPVETESTQATKSDQ